MRGRPRRARSRRVGRNACDRRLAASALAWASLSIASNVHAQTANAAAAEALFDEGRRLMQAGNYAEACPKLEASQRLDAGVGTLLNLGDCLERSGRTASAWIRFREAAAAAVAAHAAEREQIARQRANAVWAKVCRLQIGVSPAAQELPLAIARDGEPVDRALWGESIPVDPGRHEVSATAPGKRRWSSAIELAVATCGGATTKIDVPSLEDEALVTPPPAFSAPNIAPSGDSRSSRWGGQRELALAAGGAAVVAAGVASFLALDARSVYRDAQATCTRGPMPACSDRGLSAGPLADAATGVFIAAGALVVAGAVLWLTAPSHVVQLTPRLSLPSRGGPAAGSIVGLNASVTW